LASLYFEILDKSTDTGNISLGGENKITPNLFQYNFVFIQKHIKNSPWLIKIKW
jgi:hypothetical protein